ncbi:hypothetical protein GCM10010329_80420 [Streptomyces spiroverticillatus]|uniref:Uncharacterized protein n=1 Tax=Streptomyces finlayi TaxID=67296 RepID=A0A918X6Y7_9ACTN|nr:hypothetical protein [Streptomyces finlayi]GHA45811.1 hypothetical protein GCM10010329_80420 [Streptomyces spiroverticillatus]GHD15870.1 hypothetical protein GCM10010334_76340 [Streptomyces finlayi]
MTHPAARLPADPAGLRLHYAYESAPLAGPHARTVEPWTVSIRHHDPKHSTGEQGVQVGRMVFYRVRLTQGRNAHAALVDESEDLVELADAVLDPVTGYFTGEVGDRLLYAGTDLLVMDEVRLDPAWRGAALGPVLAAEAISRLVPGCRAVACTSGLRPDPGWTPDAQEWDRAARKVTAGWERIGFVRLRKETFLLDPAAEAFEQQRELLEEAFARLCRAFQDARPPR